MLAHGDVALNQLLTGILLIFGVPSLFLLLFHKKPYALPVAFAGVCTALCILLLYLTLTKR